MLQLNEVEKANVARLLKEWGYGSEQLLADFEEDCCGTRSYHFEVIPSGIGDNVYLVYKDHRECISDWESS